MRRAPNCKSAACLRSSSKSDAQTAMTPDLVVVGRVQSAHGISGELYLSLRASEAPWLETLSALTLRKTPDSQPLTLTLRQARPHRHGFIARVEEITDRNGAESWRGAELLIPGQLLVAQSGETPYLRELLDFSVFTEQDGQWQALGRVCGFQSHPGHDTLVVELRAQTRVVEIPLVAAYVVEMRMSDKQIYLRAPAELFDQQFWQAPGSSSSPSPISKTQPRAKLSQKKV